MPSHCGRPRKWRGACPHRYRFPRDGPLQSLRAFVNEYIRDHRADRLQELTAFRDLCSFEEAIQKAALATDSRGARHPHQRRFTADTLQSSARSLLAHKSKLRMARSFHELHDAVGRITSSVQGAGPLYVYDVATRIGAWCSLNPDRVYLHAGTREGVRSFGLNRRGPFLRLADLPRELRRLEAGELEDFFCIYCDELARLRR
jgi:hypothetical protein